jgi:hypothetical protein
MLDTTKKKECNRRDAEDAEKCAEKRRLLFYAFSARFSASRWLGGCISILALAVVAGCLSSPMHPATTQPVTITDPATTQPEYWYAEPSRGVAVYDSFETLFKTCENVLRDYGFRIDRVDYRTGILTSVPLISAQIWEPWRPDIQSFGDVKGSTLASIRRTVRFEIRRNDDGTFDASPKVLVERQTVQERRLTNVAIYRGAYTKEDPRDVPSGTKESDEGFMIPPKYWYAIGRDPKLEVVIAKEVSKRLAKKGREMVPLAPTTME